MAAFTDHNIAVLRIELQEIAPLIWRRVAVPTAMDLKTLHGVVQAAMGWLGCHLWEFECSPRKYGPRIPDDLDWNERVTDAETAKLSSLLTNGVTDIGYVYDMGDYWQHRIIVEKV